MFRDLLKVTAHGIDSAETRTLDPTPSWASVRTLAVRGRIPPEGARGSCGPRPPRARLLSMVARARRSAARSRGGQGRTWGGRGRTQGGRGPRRAAGDWGGGGGLPGAAREDVVRAPRRPSARELWRRRRRWATL